MSILKDQISQTLLPGMFIPEALELLFLWIEENGLFMDYSEGRTGFLYPEDKLRSSWTKNERQGGTIIEFFAEGNVNMKYWLGNPQPEALSRLCVFAKTGADGSMAAFWLDENNQQKVVHLGSGSGSVLCCILADDPIDFIRLLAIGYDEVCWNEEFSEPPNHDCTDGSLFVHPNTRFRDWVKDTFSVSIPRTALEIVVHPAEMHDENSPDPFCNWCSQWS